VRRKLPAATSGDGCWQALTLRAARSAERVVRARGMASRACGLEAQASSFGSNASSASAGTAGHALGHRFPGAVHSEQAAAAEDAVKEMHWQARLAQLELRRCAARPAAPVGGARGHADPLRARCAGGAGGQGVAAHARRRRAVGLQRLGALARGAAARRAGRGGRLPLPLPDAGPVVCTAAARILGKATHINCH